MLRASRQIVDPGDSTGVPACPFRDIPRWRSGLARLLDAAYYANDSDKPHWQFAVDTKTLYANGLTENDLRWLLLKDYIELAEEIGRPTFCRLRRFRSVGLQTVSPRHCVILTDTGIAVAESVCGSPLPKWIKAASPAGRTAALPRIPRWDDAARTLWFGSTLIKRLAVPAPNQELILSAFETNHWPNYIIDPLPPADAIDPKRRLHDTINRLNRSHRVSSIRFTGNGRGLGICWNRVRVRQSSGTTSAPDRV